MKTIEFNGKHYPVLRIRVYHAEIYPETQWLTIADETLSDVILEENNDEAKANDIDEAIYFYMPAGFDFDKVKVGDIIELDEDMKVMEIDDDG